MIRVINKNSRTCPVLLCDVCEKQIDNLGMGAAVFPRCDTEGEESQVLHVHKKQCHNLAEARIGGKAGAPWQELQDHFIWLIANSGKTLPDLVERSETLDEFGLL